MLSAAESPIIVNHLPGIVLQIQHYDGMFTIPSGSHNFRQHGMFLSKGYCRFVPCYLLERLLTIDHGKIKVKVVGFSGMQ